MSPPAHGNRRCAPWAASLILRAFNDLVIATVNGAPIRVQDIGWAEDGTKEQRSLARLNGAPTVILEVRRQSGANTVEVIKAVKENLARVLPQLPPTSYWRSSGISRATSMRRCTKSVCT